MQYLGAPDFAPLVLQPEDPPQLLRPWRLAVIIGRFGRLPRKTLVVLGQVLASQKHVGCS
jgi:hypothetical protein